MVDIVARLDTAHGEVGPFVPKMNPEMWGLEMEDVTGHPSANHPITGDVANMQDLTDEEKVHAAASAGSYSGKTGGSTEEAFYAAQEEGTDTSGISNANKASSIADRHSSDISEAMLGTGQSTSENPSSLQTTEAEQAGAMTQKPIQAPALGPDGDGDVSNDPLPEGDGEEPTGNKTIQSSPADPGSQTPGDIKDASEQALADAKAATGEADPDDTNPDDGLPSKTALNKMPKEDLVKFAEEHGVDTADGTATKESIIEALYS